MFPLVSRFIHAVQYCTGVRLSPITRTCHTFVPYAYSNNQGYEYSTVLVPVFPLPTVLYAFAAFSFRTRGLVNCEPATEPSNVNSEPRVQRVTQIQILVQILCIYVSSGLLICAIAALSPRS